MSQRGGRGQGRGGGDRGSRGRGDGGRGRGDGGRGRGSEGGREGGGGQGGRGGDRGGRGGGGGGQGGWGGQQGTGRGGQGADSSRGGPSYEQRSEQYERRESQARETGGWGGDRGGAGAQGGWRDQGRGGGGGSRGGHSYEQRSEQYERRESQARETGGWGGDRGGAGAQGGWRDQGRGGGGGSRGGHSYEQRGEQYERRESQARETGGWGGGRGGAGAQGGWRDQGRGGGGGSRGGHSYEQRGEQYERRESQASRDSGGWGGGRGGAGAQEGWGGQGRGGGGGSRGGHSYEQRGEQYERRDSQAGQQYRQEGGRGRGEGGRGRGEGGRGRGGDGGRGRGGRGGGGGYQSQQAPQIPHRPNLVKPPETTHGTKGRGILLETNYLRLNFNRSINTIYQYDVSIQPEKFKKLFVEVMEKFRVQKYGHLHPPFDGSKFLLSREPLVPQGQDLTGQVEYRRNPNSDPLVFTITLKLAKIVDLSVLDSYKQNNNIKLSQDICQIISIILRAHPLSRCISVGRNFYLPTPANTEPIKLDGGMQLYYGLYQAPTLADRGLLLNVHVLHKAFPMPVNLIELFRDICKPSEITRLSAYQKDDIMNVIRNRKVLYTVGGKVTEYVVNDFAGSPREEKLPNEGTIIDYFFKRKNYTIRYQDLQLLWVGNRDKQPHILIPPELCQLKPGQTASGKDSTQVVSKMIKHTATDTTTRRNKILDMVDTIGDYENSPFLQEFGFTVGADFELVNGRVLLPPKLQYGNDQVTPERGQWNLQKKRFLNSVVIERWVIINMDTYVSPPIIHQFQEIIVRQAEIMGIRMNPPQNFINLPISRKVFQDIKAKFEELKQNQLIIVIFSERSNIYATVKEVAELNVGCLTQCFLSKHLTNRNRPLSSNLSTVTNLLLKINTKLNGVNHKWCKKPDFLGNRHIMIMGADVTHPSPQNKSTIPSFAAVIASHDTDFYKYNTKCQIQSPTLEMIEDLKSIVLEQLEYNREQTGKEPAHIIFFRDGVSEGQFDEAKESEVKAIQQACVQFGTKIKKKYAPLITFVVVMKRHHTRFFPTDRNDADSRFLNIPAGTCVDSGITHPVALNLKDFYLASHTAIQGVTKPTKYCTIHDDAKLSYDDIEELAYYLCHMYSRCARSVSYPAPTYYAHLAAERAKKLYENQDMVRVFRELERLRKIRVNIKIAQSNPMSFV